MPSEARSQIDDLSEGLPDARPHSGFIGLSLKYKLP